MRYRIRVGEYLSQMCESQNGDCGVESAQDVDEGNALFGLNQSSQAMSGIADGMDDRKRNLCIVF